MLSFVSALVLTYSNLNSHFHPSSTRDFDRNPKSQSRFFVPILTSAVPDLGLRLRLRGSLPQDHDIRHTPFASHDCTAAYIELDNLKAQSPQ